MNRDMLSRRLIRRGYEVVIAVDGAQGVSLASSEAPDLILMDMSLPVMNGQAATRIIKGNEETRDIPVIALTALAMVGDREDALASGCDEYDTKPIELPRLLEKIEALLNRRKPAESGRIFRNEKVPWFLSRKPRHVNRADELRSQHAHQNHSPQFPLDVGRYGARVPGQPSDIRRGREETGSRESRVFQLHPVAHVRCRTVRPFRNGVRDPEICCGAPGPRRYCCRQCDHSNQSAPPAPGCGRTVPVGDGSDSGGGASRLFGRFLSSGPRAFFRRC